MPHHDTQFPRYRKQNITYHDSFSSGAILTCPKCGNYQAKDYLSLSLVLKK